MMAEWNLSDRDYELLSAYLDGALAAAERQALEQRLAVEPALRAELAALQETVTLLNQLPPRRAPRDFTLTPAMVGRETGLNRGLFSLVTSPAFSAVTAAAAVFLVVLGAFVLLQGVGTSIMPQSALAPVANQPTSEVISGGILAATRTLPGEANSQRSAANTSAPTPELQTEMLYAVPLATQTAAPTMPPPSPLPTLLAATSLPFTQALPAPEVKASDAGGTTGSALPADAFAESPEMGAQVMPTSIAGEAEAANLQQMPPPSAALPLPTMTLPPTMTATPPPTASPTLLAADTGLAEEHRGSPAAEDDLTLRQAASDEQSAPAPAPLPTGLAIIALGLALLVIAGITVLRRRRS